MSNDFNQEDSRRKFLTWLSASPLMALPNMQGAQAQSFAKRPDPMVWPAVIPDSELIKDPKDAVNVFDFEPVAYKNVPPAHFGYMASGIDDEITLRANRSAFLRYQLRPRRLRDVSLVNTSVSLFGKTWNSPIIIAPTGGNRSYHSDGELGVTRDGERFVLDFPAYPQWNPFIRSIAGVARVGERLTASIQPQGGRAMTFRPTLLVVTPNEELRWLGRLLLPGIFDGEHYFQIVAVAPDRVRFIQGERFSGLLVTLAKSQLERGTKAGFAAMNRALQARAEAAA